MESRRIGKYIVYSNGQIFDDNYKCYVKPKIKNNKYEEVKLFLLNKYTNFCVHRIVAQLFLPNFDSTKRVIHKDGDIYNNDISNLEQLTESEFKTKLAADSIPDYQVKSYDPYNMITNEFNSLSEAALYLISIGIEDSIDKIKVSIFNATDDRDETAYGYKWYSI